MIYKINQILQNKELTYQTKIESLLNLEGLPQLLVVKFAYECVLDLDQYYDIEKYSEVYKTRQTCLKLLADYILEPSASKIEKLKAAAAANAAYAYAAAYAAAAYAAYAAAYAAANAAYAAVYAANANAAAYAAYAANANAAAYAAAINTTKETKFKALYFKLVLLLNKEYNLGFDSELLEGLYL